MDDFQIVLYIVFALIYFLSRGLSKKKKKKAPPRPQQETSTTTAEEPRPRKQPSTFEDLLKELETSFGGETETAVPEPEPVRPTPPPKPKSEKDDRQRTFQEELKEYQIKPGGLKTIDEMVDLHTVSKFEPKVYETEIEDVEAEKRLKEIAGFFSKAGGPQKAIILSEIINRKYD